MIIWGWRGREIAQQSGVFNCPRCNCKQQYTEYRVATYFTLYFIPLFETSHHGDYILCHRCQGQFKVDVLNYEPPTQAEQLLWSIRADLESGTPIQMARTKLLNAGLDQAAADTLVNAAAGEHQGRCGTCQLSFIEGVARCSGCGGPLQQVMQALPAPSRRALPEAR